MLNCSLKRFQDVRFSGDGSLGKGVDPASERYRGVVRLSQVRIRILRKSTKTTFDIPKLTNVLSSHSREIAK